MGSVGAEENGSAGSMSSEMSMGSVGGEEDGSAGSMRNERNELKQSDVPGDHSSHGQHRLEMRRKSSRRFSVFACAVLASLNSVVVGYSNKLKVSSLFSEF